jgi:hypothetical protein
MKFLRLLRDNWALAIVLAVALVIVAFAPPVQTWVAQWALARQTAFPGSLGSFWAGFGKVAVHDLSLKTEGAVLTLPSLEAGLPLTKAALGRRVHIRRLVAKGWTLDLRGVAGLKGAGKNQAVPALGSAGGPQAFARVAIVSAETVTRFFRANLSQWALPCDLSLDGVDLEGDVLVATPLGGEPSRVHVVVTGGGLAAGREGVFALDASTDILSAESAAVALAAYGRFTVAMRSPRTLGRVGIKVDISASGGPYPEGLVLSEDITADASAGEGTFYLNLNRGKRALATVFAHLPDTTDRLAGTWKLDLHDSDVAAVMAGSRFPPFAAKGEGTFASDATLAQVHALGRLSVAASRLGVLAPSLERLGAVTLDAGFDAVLSGQSIRVDRLSALLTGAGPVAEVRSLQAFELDVHTGALRPVDPAGDWMKISIRKLPLAWLSAFADGLALSGADATGEFVVRAKDGGFALRSTAPLTAGGVSAQRAGRILGRNLDLSLSLLADYGSKGWQIQLAPLAVGSGGSPLATLKASVSLPVGPDQPIAVTGTWTADLQALATKAVVPDLSWISGRSASGDFTATLGASTELDGKMAFVGSDPRHLMTASLHAEVDSGRISFRAPVTIAFGPVVSDLSVEGTSISDGALYLKLTGKKAVLGHLGLLAARLAAAGVVPQPATAGVRDGVPFWGNWTGRVMVAFDRLDAGDRVFDDLGGTFEVGRDSVRLTEGRGKLGDRRLAKAEGSISFDPTAKFPYSLTATASLDGVDATALFPAPASGRDPVIEGRFAIAATLAGDGINLDDLAGRVRESLRITSTAGAIRVLKTDVDEAIPQEKQSSVSEDLGRMGSGIGRIFGTEGSIGSGRRSVSPAAQAAIDVVNAISEIGIDEVSLTAVRESDGTIRLADIAMTAGDVRMTGSGQIGHVEGRPLRAQPLSVDLQFWARGRIAKLLSAAGLLSGRKDDGYAALNQPIQLRGTLEKIDTSQWHAVLVRAAERKPPAPKPAP